jgi:hypothetical protein
MGERSSLTQANYKDCLYASTCQADFWGRIEIMHLSPSISTGKAPMDPALVRIALSRQRHNVLPQMIEALHAFGQTPPLKNADLDLGHIQPAAVFGRVMHLQSPVAARYAALPPGEGLVEASCRVRVEIVHHQADYACLGIDLIDKPPDRLSKIQPGALLGHLDTAASPQRFDEHKQVRRSQALVLRVRTLGISWFH